MGEKDGGKNSKLLKIKNKDNFQTIPEQLQYFCIKCGAWKGQLGLEPTWLLYIKHMVEICEEIKHVLKKTGSMYINIGDTFAGSSGGNLRTLAFRNEKQPEACLYYKPYPHRKAEGYKPKCLMGIPWRLAFALIDAGWILRNSIIWEKPNCLPSSVKDRLTLTYEYVFHFVKNKKYYYNLDMIREPYKTLFKPFNLRVRDVKRGKRGISAFGVLKASEDEIKNYVYPEKTNISLNNHKIAEYINQIHSIAKNIAKSIDYNGKVAKIKTQKGSNIFKNAMREAYTILEKQCKLSNDEKQILRDYIQNHSGHPIGKNPGDVWRINTRPFKGAHFAVYPIDLCLRPILSSCPPDGVILDPFCGSGTTLLTAKLINMKRWDAFKIPVNEIAQKTNWNLKYIGIELNPEYIEMAEKRLAAN